MTVSIKPLTLPIQGMTCASCVAHVERALTELDGVLGAVVNLGLGTARVLAIPGVVTISAMKQAVRDAGYEAAERGGDVDALDRERQARADEIRQQGRNLLIAGTVGLLVMIGTFYDMLGPLQAVVPVWLWYKANHAHRPASPRRRSSEPASSLASARVLEIRRIHYGT